MSIKHILSVGAVSLALVGCAGDVPPEVSVTGAWARATPPGAPVGAAYFELQNHSAVQDNLIAVESPVAGRIEIHATGMHDGMMTMSPVHPLQLPSKETVKLQPGGIHVMLLDLKQPLVAGDSFPLTLKFQNAPQVSVDVKIAAVGAGAAPQS